IVVRVPSALAASTRACIGSTGASVAAVVGALVGASVAGAWDAPPPQAATTIARIAPPTMRRGSVRGLVNFSSNTRSTAGCRALQCDGRSPDGSASAGCRERRNWLNAEADFRGSGHAARSGSVQPRAIVGTHLGCSVNGASSLSHHILWITRESTSRPRGGPPAGGASSGEGSGRSYGSHAFQTVGLSSTHFLAAASAVMPWLVM